MSTLTHITTLVQTSCWCGIALAVPQELYNEAQRAGHGIYCPIGHSFVFGNTTEKKLRETQERLAEERRRLTATRDLLHQEERSHSATRGHLTRTKKRVAHGVCPCCNRTFQNLGRHMQTKHPDYDKNGAAA
jgi:hypothetical protein